MAQNASAQAVVLGQGVLPPVKLGASKCPSSGGWREESPQARCSVVRRFKSVRCLISLHRQPRRIRYSGRLHSQKCCSPLNQTPEQLWLCCGKCYGCSGDKQHTSSAFPWSFSPFLTSASRAMVARRVGKRQVTRQWRLLSYS